MKRGFGHEFAAESCVPRVLNRWSVAGNEGETTTPTTRGRLLAPVNERVAVKWKRAARAVNPQD